MNPEEQKLNTLRSLGMTQIERATMRHLLQAYTIANPASSGSGSVVLQWVRSHALMAGSLAVLLLAGGVGVSANSARPGDALYGFRTSVNDNVQTALAFGDDAQIDVQSSQIGRLLDDEDVIREQDLSATAASASLDVLKKDTEDSARDTQNGPRADSDKKHDREDDSASIGKKIPSDPEFEREMKQLEHDIKSEGNSSEKNDSELED